MSNEAVPPQPRSLVTERDRQFAFLAVLAYLLFSFGIPLIELPHLHGRAMGLLVGWATIGTTLLFMFLQLWVPRSLVALRMSLLTATLVVILCAVCWTAFVKVLASEHAHRVFGSPEGAVCVSGMGIALTLGLTCVGSVLSRIIREPNVLMPVAFIAMPIDYIGAMTPTGYTADMVKHHPSVVRSVSVSVPTFHGVAPIGFIGPGDVLFIAFFLAVVQNLDMNRKATFWLMYLLLTATMFIVTIFHFDIAALVPMGLAVLIANFRQFKLQRSEVFASLYAGLIVLALVVAFYVYSHHHFFRGGH